VIKISVAEAKSHLSELISKSVHANEKCIITRRNKPVAALVSIDDLRIIEQHEERQGLALLAGKWKGFDEVAQHIDDMEALRETGGCGRNVSF
jgi:prevent-host-death family protein